MKTAIAIGAILPIIILCWLTDQTPMEIWNKPANVEFIIEVLFIGKVAIIMCLLIGGSTGYLVGSLINQFSKNRLPVVLLFVTMILFSVSAGLMYERGPKFGYVVSSIMFLFLFLHYLQKINQPSK